MGSLPRSSDKRAGEAALRKLRAEGEAWITVGGDRARVRCSVPVGFYADGGTCLRIGAYASEGVLVVHGGRLQLAVRSSQGHSGNGARLTGDFTPHTFERDEILGEVLEVYVRPPPPHKAAP